MSSHLLISLAVNTLAFGAMGFNSNRLGLRVPKAFSNSVVQFVITFIYYGSFVLILLSPENWIIKILLCLLMQFLLNHLIWGAVLGVIAGLIDRKHKRSS